VPTVRVSDFQATEIDPGQGRIHGIDAGKASDGDVRALEEKLFGKQLPTNGSGTMPKGGGSENILIALAQHGPMRAAKLRVLAGIASMHTFRKYIGQHRAAGRVQGTDPITITPHGRQIIGDFTPLPTGKALIGYWIGELGPGHAQIFRTLIASPHYAFPQAELMSRSNIQSEHTYRKYVGRLTNLGLAARMGKFITLAPDFRNL
jgi:hypothetical protein